MTAVGLDLDRQPRFGRARALASIGGVLLVVASWWQVAASGEAVTRISVEREGLPVTLLVPDAAPAPAPGVVVAHGFGGSATLVRSYGLALARAGYVVALPDLTGHGTNRTPLPLDADRDDALVRDVVLASAELTSRPEVDRDRLALVGHSMGAGAVVRGAAGHPDGIVAVVAVSPVEVDVDDTSPPNLLLLAGERERAFVATAQDLLDRAGGPSPAMSLGRARALHVVPSVEHTSVLFSPVTHDETVAWLDLATGTDRDRGDLEPVWLIGWWALALVGTLVLWRAVAPLLVARQVIELRRGRPLLGLVAGGVIATLVSTFLDAFVDTRTVGGMAVGPTLALWFLVAGLVWVRIGPRPAPPGGRDVTWALVLVAVLVVAFGALASRVWLPGLPSGIRWAHLVLYGGALVPWGVAFASTLDGRRGWRALGWWIAVAGVVMITLGAAANTVADLAFLTTVLPAVPALLGLAMIVWLPVQRPWAAGLATALFLGWTIATIFPLS